jgi:hypothetical protein
MYVGYVTTSCKLLDRWNALHPAWLIHKTVANHTLAFFCVCNFVSLYRIRALRTFGMRGLYLQCIDNALQGKY